MFKVFLCSLTLSAMAFAQEGYDLTLGRAELGVNAGMNYGFDRQLFEPQTPWSAGAHAAFGLHRLFAVTAEYSYDDVGTFEPAGIKEQAQTLMGGFRVAAANSSHIEPYGSFSMGLARLQGSSPTVQVLGINVGVNAAMNKLAFAPGGGINFKVTRHFGIGVDMRAIRIMDSSWQFRTGLGVFFRL